MTPYPSMQYYNKRRKEERTFRDLMADNVETAMNKWFDLADREWEYKFQFGSDLGSGLEHSKWYPAIVKEHFIHPVWFDYHWYRYSNKEYDGMKNSVLIQRFKVVGDMGEMFKKCWDEENEGGRNAINIDLYVGFYIDSKNVKGNQIHVTKEHSEITYIDINFNNLRLEKLEKLNKDIERLLSK